MMRAMLTPGLRRPPALMLVPSLLLMGVLVTRAPVRDAGYDSVGAHAQVVRAPVVRVPTGTAAVLPALGLILPVAAPVREAAPRLGPQQPVSSAVLTTYLSRAPPASS